MSDERRRFQRLPIPGDTVATTLDGRYLGRVTRAGGGGMQLEDLSGDGERELKPGERLRVQVVEPAIDATHTVEVRVRYQKDGKAGVEFVAEKAAGSK